MNKQTDIRLKRGRKITTLDELREFQSDMKGESLLFGSASNYELVRYDSVLYSEDELYVKELLRIPVEGMAAVNMAVGAMGRGKTTLLNNIVAHRPNNNMIIHDPKGEFNPAFYDEELDMIVAYPDTHSVIWDVFGEIRKDRQVGELIWRNMLLSIRGGEENKEGEEWVTYAVAWLAKLAARIIDDNIAHENVPVEIVRLYKAFKAETAGQQTGMQSDAIGTAAPVFNLLFQTYYVGTRDNRRFVTVGDMTNARRVFLCNNKQFAAQLDVVNNALLACLINTYLSRPNVPRERTDKYTFFILDEFLTFKLDQTSEAALLTLCRSKGVSVWLGMQFLPPEKNRLTRITASRYLTAVFKIDDAYTQEEIEKLTDDVEYQRMEHTISIGDTNSMTSLSGGVNFNETPTDVKTKQIPRGMLTELSPYVAYVEINDISGRNKTFVKPVYVKTLTNPARVCEETGEEGFLYSDVARYAPRIDEVM